MRREEGFTLVELVIAVMILGILVAAISEAMWVGLRSTAETDDRLRESGDQELIATYLVPDMQSSADVSQTDAACSGGGSVVVRFSWIEDTGAALVNKVASYVTETVGTERRLIRRFCSGTASITSATTPESRLQIAHRLATSSPTVACPPAASCSGAPPVLTMTVNQTSGRSFSVTATRRTT